MKRAIVTLGILFSLTLALFPATAVASEAFILNIPLRFNANQETGEVRFALDLSAPPAGSQLVVNGNLTLNLGDTQAVGADSVSFKAGVGNSVFVVYKPLSNFGADFCAGGAAVEKNVPMRFVGAQDVLTYRISSYVVAAPAVECSQASRRTADTPANLVPNDDGVAPALNALYSGRLPLDVVLVLDKSGSIADLPPDAVSGATKVQILKSAVETFVAQWQQLDAQTVDGAEWSNDRLAVVFFDNAAVAQTLVGADPPANVFLRRGAANAWQNVIDKVDTLTPGGSTSIGGGINEGMKQWKADPVNDSTIVLVTDGIQNTAPLITPTGSGFLGLLPVSGLPQELRKRFIPIQTIGFGMPAAVDEALLKSISLETAGRSYISVNATTVFNTFAWTLVAILKGNTASLASSRSASVVGAGPTAVLPVVVDASARRVVFSVQWAPPQRDLLDLEVFPPGAAIPPSGGGAVPASSSHLPQAALQTFNIAASDLGTWNVRVKRTPAGMRDINTPIPYTLNVFFLEKHLDYRLSLDTIRTGTGDSMRVVANVLYDGKPLAGLPAGAIRVRIQRPPEGLGTILHDSKVDVGSGNSVTPTGDILTPYDRKLGRLTGPSLVSRVLPKDFASIALLEEKRGVYANTFAQTSVPGVYGFDVVLDWDDPRTGHVRREERVEQHVKVTPDPTASVLTATNNGGGTFTISVTPRDRFGNYMGPGYGSIVKATLRSTGTLGNRGIAVDTDQSGNYTFTVTGVPSGQTPSVDITVDGVLIGNSAKLKAKVATIPTGKLTHH
jgi:hypothetical protein